MTVSFDHQFAVSHDITKEWIQPCTTGWEAMFCWKISNRSSRFSSSSPLHPDILFMIGSVQNKTRIKIRSDKHICLRESSNRVKFSIWIQCFYSASTTRVAVVPDFSSRDCHAHSPVSYCRSAASTMGGVAEAFSPRLSSLFCLFVRIRDYDVTVEKIPYLHAYLHEFSALSSFFFVLLWHNKIIPDYFSPPSPGRATFLFLFALRMLERSRIAKLQRYGAPTGNRTRGKRMATIYFTTKHIF